MLNRAEVIQNNFIHQVKKELFPQPPTNIRARLVTPTKNQLIDLFESQMMSRHLDLTARKLRARNHSFYTIGSSGHEGNAAFGQVFRPDDMAFLHYRSGAFTIQRAKQVAGSTPLYDFLLSFAASADDPISGGRHKVIGSLNLNIPPQTSTIASHLPKSVGAALSIPKAHACQFKPTLSKDSVVLSSFGDASFNHSTAQGALQAAEWTNHQNVPLPLVFICEDNGLGISVNTPNNWIKTCVQGRQNLHYIPCNGLHIIDLLTAATEADNIARHQQKPVFLHMQTIRLLGHAGSDVETEYLTLQQIENNEAQDPLLHTARIIKEHNFLSTDAINELYLDIQNRIERIAEQVITKPKLTSPQKIMEPIVPQQRYAHKHSIPRHAPSSDERQQRFGKEWHLMKRKHHMAKLINWALIDLLLEVPNAVVFGEDVAQKGGVYHVTTGLWQRFGSQRVFNSLLDEQSILGSAIGMAHNGFLPIPEIQFLAYLHNAEDQIRGEASTLSFFSNGQYTNPMVVRIAGLAYQKGFGGHFHNDNSLAVLRDIPGLIIACPSNGYDAVTMLRSCVRTANRTGRVCVFIEPIALYMTKHLQSADDFIWSAHYPEPDIEAEIGKAQVHGQGRQVLIITYGNGYYLSRQAALTLEEENIEVTIIDLRWLAPLDENTIIKQAEQHNNILIVDECRETGSISEAIVTLITEQTSSTKTIARVTAKDSFIPLGDAANLVLPSKTDIIQAVKDLVSQQSAKLSIVKK